MFQSWHETFTNLEKFHYVKRNVEQSNYISNNNVHIIQGKLKCPDIMQMTSRKQNNDFFYNIDYDHQPNYNYNSTSYVSYYLTDPHGEHV